MKNHIAFGPYNENDLALSEDFVKVADIKDIRPSQMKEVEVNGENICVVNVEGKYYAIGSICTHEGGPLADGTLEGYEVECPWHNSKIAIGFIPCFDANSCITCKASSLPLTGSL
jgi:hypothetical protein